MRVGIDDYDQRLCSIFPTVATALVCRICRTQATALHKVLEEGTRASRRLKSTNSQENPITREHTWKPHKYMSILNSQSKTSPSSYPIILTLTCTVHDSIVQIHMYTYVRDLHWAGNHVSWGKNHTQGRRTWNMYMRAHVAHHEALRFRRLWGMLSVVDHHQKFVVADLRAHLGPHNVAVGHHGGRLRAHLHLCQCHRAGCVNHSWTHDEFWWEATYRINSVTILPTPADSRSLANIILWTGKSITTTTICGRRDGTRSNIQRRCNIPQSCLSCSLSDEHKDIGSLQKSHAFVPMFAQSRLGPNSSHLAPS